MMNPTFPVPVGCRFEDPDPVVLEGVRLFERRLYRRLLPRLQMFTTFEIFYAQAGTLGENVLGWYVRGTWERPVVILDIHTHRELAAAQRVNVWATVRTTICHELAHAIQEAHGLPLDNQEAENFALSYVELGSIDRFWERPHAPVEDDIPFRQSDPSGR